MAINPFIKGIIANEGDVSNIPLTPDSENPEILNYQEGIPPITSQRKPPFGVGKPPRRADFNAALKMLSGFALAEQLGETTLRTFDVRMTEPPFTGYGEGAVLYNFVGLNNVQLLRSAKNDNVSNFVEDPSFIGTDWVEVFPASYLDVNISNISSDGKINIMNIGSVSGADYQDFGTSFADGAVFTTDSYGNVLLEATADAAGRGLSIMIDGTTYINTNRSTSAVSFSVILPDVPAGVNIKLGYTAGVTITKARLFRKKGNS